MLFKLFIRVCARKKKQQARYFIHEHYFHRKANESTNNVSVSHFKHVFKQRCLPIVDGYTCIIADCPICNNVENRSKLYVNKRTGFFMCDKCTFNGSWNILEQILLKQISSEKFREIILLKKNKQRNEDFDKKWKEKKEKCKNIMDLTTNEYDALLDNFSFPPVLQADMSQLQCIYDKTSNILYFPLIGLNNSIVGYKSVTTDQKLEHTFPATEVSGCIEYKQCNSKMPLQCESTAVVVGMIDDLLALISQKSSNVIICLPYNLKTLPQRLLPYMESYNKLILWFGNDEISWYTVRQFAIKLNEKRCYFVRPTDVQPRPKLAADIGCNLKNILQNVQSVWHKSIITFHELREEVLSDLQNIDKVQGIKWKRYPTLNRLLKGHRRGELTILTGPTDLAMQGVNTLWGSFEIRNARLARTMLQQMVGMPLDENLEMFNLYADAFEKLPIYFMTFHGQQALKVVIDAIEHATYVYDIAHVIIDNVQFMMGTSNDTKFMDRFWKQDDIISKFRNFATEQNCHVTAIIHPRKERIEEGLTTASIFGGAKASQEADNVLIIQDNRLSSGRGKKFLQVAKNRYSGDLGIMKLEFEKSSLSYSVKTKLKNTEDDKLCLRQTQVITD
ncbi:mitochondrial DNA helicase isoform X2 [Ptiloglossa arizonensis]|uniref:mitochondrial DNA helicase isoform X2 n=1 Tax=Ptiloglossa arizonensis TaxID=3350558 RepID=UPI003FA00F87